MRDRALVLVAAANAWAVDSPLTVNVLVLNFDPLVPSEGGQRVHAALGFDDPHALAPQLVQAITNASGGFVNYDIVQWQDLDAVPVKTDGFAYTPDEYVDLWRSGGPFHDPDLTDYPALLNAYVSPQAVNEGAIDEVWLFGAPYFGFHESAMAGPGAFYVNGGVYPDFPTTRPFVLMGFNYERQLDAMLHSLGHRAESSISRFFGGWDITNPATLWDRYTTNVGQTASGPYGVGSVHYPANAVADYEYGSSRGGSQHCRRLVELSESDGRGARRLCR